MGKKLRLEEKWIIIFHHLYGTWGEKYYYEYKLWGKIFVYENIYPCLHGFEGGDGIDGHLEVGVEHAEPLAPRPHLRHTLR